MKMMETMKMMVLVSGLSELTSRAREYSLISDAFIMHVFHLNVIIIMTLNKVYYN